MFSMLFVCTVTVDSVKYGYILSYVYTVSVVVNRSVMLLLVIMYSSFGEERDPVLPFTRYVS